MPNYTTNSNYQPAAPSDPLAVGGRWGQAVGGVGAGLQSIADEIKAEGLPFGLLEGTKAKVDKLIAEYGDPESKTFEGLTGSQRTTKLVALLQPLDPAMALRYETRAAEQRTKDFGGQKPKASSDTGSADLDAEIAKTEKDIAEVQAQIAKSEGNHSTTPAAAPSAPVTAPTPAPSAPVTAPTVAPAPATAAPTLGIYTPAPAVSPQRGPTLLESMGGTYGTGTPTLHGYAPSYAGKGGDYSRTPSNPMASRTAADQIRGYRPNTDGGMRAGFVPGRPPYETREEMLRRLDQEARQYRGAPGVEDTDGY